MDEPYSNRELKHYFEDLFKRMDKQDLKLDSIEKQAFKTNGRVSRLEWWRGAVVWAIGVIGVLLIFLLPYVFKLINKVNKLDYAITNVIEDYK